jgi:TetR/AcrR family transcriptional repressor of nem operon
MHLDKGFVGGCLFGNIALETADGNSAISEAVGRVFSDWAIRLEKVVAAGQKEGEITRTLNAHTLATLIISSVEGSVMLSRLNKTEKHLKGVLDSLRALLFTTETSHP